MPSFLSDGIDIAFEVHGAGKPILLIHGFGSSGKVNWVDTGWVERLSAAGYQPITLDNRGHGASQKLYDPSQYFPRLMAEDARGLLDFLGLGRVPVIGYSMGARIAAFLALRHPQRVAAAVWGGMGLNLVSGLADSAEIIAALAAPSIEQVRGKTGRMFRNFADHTASDRQALAACMATSREPMTAAEVQAIETPILVVVGSEDQMAGDPHALGELLGRGEVLVIERRDHMRTTGDPLFKRAAIEFLDRHPA